MTREEAVAQLKAAKDAPVPVGAGEVRAVGELDQADLQAVAGFDVDSLISTLEKILPWVAVFVPQLGPIIPFLPTIRDIITLIQQLIQQFGPAEVHAMLAEAA